MRTLILSLTVFAAACGTFEPTPGTWEATDATLVRNDCNVETEDTEMGVLRLDVDDAGQVEIDIDPASEEGPVFLCDIEDRTLVCPSHVESDSMEGATISWTLKLGGSFRDAKSLDADGMIGMSCTGEACGLVGEFLDVDFPCESTFTFVAALQE